MTKGENVARWLVDKGLTLPNILAVVTFGTGAAGGISYIFNHHSQMINRIPPSFVCVYKGLERTLDKDHPEWRDDSLLSMQKRTTYFSGEIPSNPTGSAEEFRSIVIEGETARELVKAACSENPYHYW